VAPPPAPAPRAPLADDNVEEPRPVAPPPRPTLDFIPALTSETVTLDTSEGNCHITGGSDTCELVTFDPEEFPVVSRFSDENAISIQAGRFTSLVNRTVFAAAREQGRYAMHGVLTEIEGDMLRMVATDGRRLAIAHVPLDSADHKPEPAIVPTKGMQLFCRVIDDALEQVKIRFGENQIGLKTSKAEVFARLLDGEFPRYSAVIPKETEHTVHADADLLGRKIRLVANVTGDEARAVRFSLKKDHMELFGQSAGRGEATAHMDVEYPGAQADIAFNPDYVNDGLKNCESDTVQLQFNEKTSPGKFTLGENYIYVVMPITIDT
jgi:DNA polymerase-3 subunit beta